MQHNSELLLFPRQYIFTDFSENDDISATVKIFWIKSRTRQQGVVLLNEFSQFHIDFHPGKGMWRGKTIQAWNRVQIGKQKIDVLQKSAIFI